MAELRLATQADVQGIVALNQSFHLDLAHQPDKLIR